MRASYYRYFDIAFMLLDNGADVNSVDDSEWTILMYATYYGQTDLVKKLVEGGARLETTKPSDGTTALMWGAANGHLDVVKYLVQKGAKVNAEDVSGYTALDKAKMGSFNDVVKYLESVGGIGNYNGEGGGDDDYYGGDDTYGDDDDDDDSYNGEYGSVEDDDNEEYTGEY
jgi:ankyrin repeat protein